MNFLSCFKNAQPEALEMEELPSRRRTFSATQFREEELARAAAARAAQEIADAELAAQAETARAQRLAEAENQYEDIGDGFGASDSTSSNEPPLDYEEAIAWLSARCPSASSRDSIATG
jgi:hypothetical protein